jgi:hypothetical protein
VAATALLVVCGALVSAPSQTTFARHAGPHLGSKTNHTSAHRFTSRFASSTNSGTYITVNKSFCNTIGQQNTCNGKPTVASFGTPLLCTSQLCGPVVDEQLLAFQQIGQMANFIHVEEFLPGPDLKAPAPTLENISPAFKAWGLQTDPWVVIIDRRGIIRFRSLGPVTAPEIESALKPLL